MRRAFDRARDQGRLDVLREDIAMRRAVDVLVESAKPIPLDQARAREALWTPDKEDDREGSKRPGRLWTPGRR